MGEGGKNICLETAFLVCFCTSYCSHKTGDFKIVMINQNIPLKCNFEKTKHFSNFESLKAHPMLTFIQNVYAFHCGLHNTDKNIDCGCIFWFTNMTSFGITENELKQIHKLNGGRGKGT